MFRPPGRERPGAPGPKRRQTHVHAHSRDASCGIRLQAQLHDAGQRREADLTLLRQPALIEVFPDAAAGVAAHPAFGAVGIENAHSEVRLRARRWFDQHEAVGANAGMRAAPVAGRRGRVGNRIQGRIDIDIVVPRTVHFREMDLHITEDEFTNYSPNRRFFPGEFINKIFDEENVRIIDVIL